MVKKAYKKSVELSGLNIIKKETISVPLKGLKITKIEKAKIKLEKLRLAEKISQEIDATTFSR
jgi:transcriptional regulator of met regulon